ncbi:hypothetical protein C1645_816945 [Glomus cerebriforme]|uniref:Uncharacterized protein n=1 Tax=Glomus cerebriforme TaxID=658196 RepID=A0A397TFS0_9GLOM|nr:hypothetical protein C1645_816945 [Glomus cerebriforme]
MQSIDSLRVLNSKLLAEIAELRKENAKIPELRKKLLKFAVVEAENVKLRQIIEENAKHDAENAELKTEIKRCRNVMNIYNTLDTFEQLVYIAF